MYQNIDHSTIKNNITGERSANGTNLQLFNYLPTYLSLSHLSIYPSISLTSSPSPFSLSLSLSIPPSLNASIHLSLLSLSLYLSISIYLYLSTSITRVLEKSGVVALVFDVLFTVVRSLDDLVKLLLLHVVLDGTHVRARLLVTVH